jgi:hypothetical protein
MMVVLVRARNIGGQEEPFGSKRRMTAAPLLILIPTVCIMHFHLEFSIHQLCFLDLFGILHIQSDIYHNIDTFYWY